MHLPRVKSFANVVEQVRDVFKSYKHEKESEAHQVCIPRLPLQSLFKFFQIFRKASIKHQPKGVLPTTLLPVTVNPVCYAISKFCVVELMSD